MNIEKIKSINHFKIKRKRNMLLNTIGNFSLTLCVAFMFSNCDDNTDQQPQNTPFTVTMAKDWYNTKFKESEEWKENSESKNMVPDWNHATFRKLDGLEVVELQLVQEETEIEIPSTKELNTTLLKIAFMKTKSDDIVARKLYYTPESNYYNKSSYPKNEIDLSKYDSNFVGLLITKKWNNETLSYKNIDNKAIVELAIPKDFENTGKSTKSTTGKLLSSEDPYAWYIQLGSCLIKGSQSKIDYWYYNPITGKSDLYKGSYYNNNTYQYNGYYYPLMSGSTAAAAVNTAQSIENDITTQNIDPCVYSVLTKLKNTTNFDIATIFTAFGASTKMNLKIVSGVPRKMGDIADTYRTDPKIAFNYTITFTKDYTSATQLFKATVLLHELVHAYFMSLLDNPSRDHEFDLFQNYPILFQAYCDKKYPGGKESHHEEMANTYVNIMGSALQEFQTGKPVTNGIPNQFYLDLAWGGLQKTPVFEKKFPIGSAERIRIESIFGAESRGGYTNGYTPIGVKCN